MLEATRWLLIAEISNEADGGVSRPDAVHNSEVNITSQGNKNMLTIVAESQARSGHDILARPAWYALSYAKQLEPLDDVMNPLIKSYGKVSPAAEFLCKSGGHWVAVPAVTGTQVKPPCLRLDLFQLYSHDGRYDYARGWNLRAIGALVVGWIPPLIGLWDISRTPAPAVAPLGFLWQGGWLFSIIVAALAYAWFMRSDRSRITATEYDAITAAEDDPIVQHVAAAEVTPA